jgi:hypothetical protein
MSSLQKFHRRTNNAPSGPAALWDYTISSRIGPAVVGPTLSITTIDDTWLNSVGCPSAVLAIELTNTVDIVGGLKFVALTGGRSTATIKLTNQGVIAGCGGGYNNLASGVQPGGSYTGKNGGPAIVAQRAVTIVNSGVIGGGGGSGAAYKYGGGWGGGSGSYHDATKYWGAGARASSPLSGAGATGMSGAIGGSIYGGGGGAGASSHGGSNGSAGGMSSGSYSGGGGGSAGAAGGNGYYKSVLKPGGSGGAAVSGKTYVNNGSGISGGTIFGTQA